MLGLKSMSGQPTQDIKQGPIEIDYNALALIVNYTIEKHIIDENGRVAEVIGRTNKVQRIKLHSLSPDKNMAKLADEIIRNCNRIIHPARAEELEQLLLKLQKHAAAHKDDAKPAGPSNDGEKSDSKKGQNEVKVKKSRSMEENTSNSRADRDEGRFQPPPEPQEIVLPPSNMADLDDYLELLYQVPSSNSNTRNKKDDGMSEQVRGTAMLLQLCKDDVMNLEQLIQNNTVMGALTRVLQEEFKKSIELTFNILRIFLSFSNFVEMHELMSNYRIGLLTMKVSLIGYSLFLVNVALWLCFF